MISKRTILILMAVWVFASIYYQEYKKEQKMLSTPTLNTVMLSSIDGTDPAATSEKYTTEVVSRVYEGLYSYHYLKKPYELMANLAEAMPSISSNGLVYIFKIKQGVRFHDNLCFPNGKGRVVKAADFVYSLKRLLDPKNTKVPFRELIQGKIKGLDAWGQQMIQEPQTDYTQEVEGLKVLDDYTLQVTLNEPWSAFLHFLAMPCAFVVAKEAVTHYGLQFLNHPVGTGPFVLEGTFNPQAKQLVFLKNPSFRETLFPTQGHPAYQAMIAAYGGKKMPFVDKVVVDIIKEEQPRILKLESGELDMAQVSNSPVGLNMIQNNVLLPKWREKGLSLVQAPSVNTWYFAFNHKHDFFKDTYLRQAMSMAFDRETYNQTFFNGGAQIAHSLVPPVFIDDSSPIVSPYGYDLERAKAYLVKAGYPEAKGIPVITLDIGTSSNKDKADFFANCMAKIGIKIQIQVTPSSEFWKKVHRGDMMMHLMAWCADYPDPLCFFQILNSKDMSGLFYENDRFNALFSKAMATADQVERKALYAELHKIATEEVPAMYLVHTAERYFHYNWVKNLVANDFCPCVDQYLAIDMAAKIKTTK